MQKDLILRGIGTTKSNISSSYQSTKVFKFMEFPQNLKYTADHEWILVEGETALVGITDFAQGELGDIVYLDIPSVGEDLAQGEVFGTIEAVKTVSDLFMPVSGKILEANDAVNDAPESVNQSPYTDGWMVRIQLTNPAELDSLMDVATYRKQIGK